MSRRAVKEQFVVVAYDIADPRRLARVAKVMRNYGDRVEESVFEARLSPGDLLQMERELRTEMDEQRDVVRIYFLCAACVPRTRVLGAGLPPDDPEVVVVG